MLCEGATEELQWAITMTNWNYQVLNTYCNLCILPSLHDFSCDNRDGKGIFWKYLEGTIDL